MTAKDLVTWPGRVALAGFEPVARAPNDLFNRINGDADSAGIAHKDAVAQKA